MSDLYFACKWLIRSRAPYKRLVETAWELGSTLVSIKPDEVTQEGYHYIKFAINVPSKAVLDEFIGKVGAEIGLSDWWPVSQEYYSQGIPFFDIRDIPPYTHSLWARWLDGIDRAGKRNEFLLRGASVTEFYDQLAADYELIFEDWEAGVVRQGETLAAFLRAQDFPPPRTVLDCTCGIGTQAIGLAKQDYTVHGTDISPASIEKAQENAVRLGANVTFGVADVRQLMQQVEGTFDLVVSFDNGLPHLLTDSDLLFAASGMWSKLKPGGALVASIRDYDQAVKDKPHSTLPRVYDQNGERRIIFQVWDWAADGKTYTLQHFIVRGDGKQWTTTHGSTLYRALLRGELSAILTQAGFHDVQWHMPEQSGYYQPIVTARKPNE